MLGKILRFVRNYYLYIYYWVSETNKNKKGKAEKFMGFLAISLFAIPVKIMSVVLLSAGYVGELLKGVLREFNSHVFLTYYKGDVTGLVIFVWLLGLLIGYIVCFWNVEYEDIPKRLARHAFFSKYSGLKLFTLLQIPTFMLLSFGVMSMIFAA